MSITAYSRVYSVDAFVVNDRTAYSWLLIIDPGCIRLYRVRYHIRSSRRDIGLLLQCARAERTHCASRTQGAFLRFDNRGCRAESRGLGDFWGTEVTSGAQGRSPGGGLGAKPPEAEINCHIYSTEKPFNNMFLLCFIMHSE